MRSPGKTKDVEQWLTECIRRGDFGRDTPLPGDLEVARRLKVSRGTVRSAFEELRRQGLIERRPGAGTFLSRLGTRRSGVVGLLIPEADSCEFFRDVEREFIRYGKRQGRKVVVRKLGLGPSGDLAARMRRMARELAVLPVEGVVFRPLINEGHARINQEVVRIFQRAETPVVLFDADVETKPNRSECDIVSVDNINAGRQVVEYLVARGRRRIAFSMVDTVEGANETLQSRFFGVAGESVLRGLKDGVRPLETVPEDADGLGRLFRSRWRPDAIVCANDEVAVRFVSAVKGIGLRIPEDVAVVGFDDVECARSSVPPLTTVRQPSGLIAQTLLKTLLLRMRNPGMPPRDVLLKAPLIPRATA